MNICIRDLSLNDSLLFLYRFGLKMSFISNMNQDARSPSEILYKYFIKTELPRNTLLDDLQSKYFMKIVQKQQQELHICTEQYLEESGHWELYGNRLIQNISLDGDDEEDLEIQLNQETFIGSLDRFGNGFGNTNYFSFHLKLMLYYAVNNHD